MPPAKKRRKKVEPKSHGLTAAEVGSGDPSPAARELARAIEDDGGSALATYRDPLGGHWQVLAALPIDAVEPTPFQRDLSDPHVKRLTGVLGALGRFLDPIIAVRGDGKYWTPNGNHRLAALRASGAKSVVALVLPEPEVAYKILALNTRRRTTSGRRPSRSFAWRGTSRAATSAPRRTTSSSSRRRRT
jgi:ParB family chromosome partitioning protein